MSAKGVKGGRELIHDFVNYVNKVLTEEMRDFFNDQLEIFDQSLDQLTDGSGETLEQYAAFKKYEEILGDKIESFCDSQGYDSAASCFEAIQDALDDDKNSHANLIKDLQLQIAKMMRGQFAEADSKADSRGAKGEDSDDDGDAKGGSADAKSEEKGSSSPSKDTAPEDKGGDSKATTVADSKIPESSGPPMINFPMIPLPLDVMIKRILSLTEYTTFSLIMRQKVQEVKFARMLKAKMARQADDIDERVRQLGSSSVRFYYSTELFGSLKTRLKDLVADAVQLIDTHINEEVWDKLLDMNGPPTEDADKLKLKQIIAYTFGFMDRLGVLEDFLAMRKISQKFMEMIDSGSPMEDIANEYLRESHSTLDTIESKLFDIYKTAKII
jgi:hypothetical protein